MAAGFDMDFYLDWRWDGVPNGYNMLLRNVDDPLSRKGDKSYFNADSGTPISEFLDEYEPRLREAETADGNFNFITCNHDTARVAPRLSQREIALAYCTLFAMPGVPFLYYGDEIGMRYRALPGKEGGYVRTGSRTPMQWGANDASGALHVSDSAESDTRAGDVTGGSYLPPTRPPTPRPSPHSRPTPNHCGIRCAPYSTSRGNATPCGRGLRSMQSNAIECSFSSVPPTCRS